MKTPIPQARFGKTLAVTAGTIFTLGAVILSGPALAGAACVTDDVERLVCLDQPAERIVALSPGITELLFAAGAGEHIVGAVSYSDYPAGAEDIPRIGSFKRVDLESVLARKPDLIVAWVTGNPMEQVEKLEQLGLPVYYGEQRNFEDVATTLERFGQLAGTANVAQAAAAVFRDGIQALRDRYRDADPVRVFYQIWDDPIMTVNGEHLISQAGELCGAVNVFGDLRRLSPRVDLESVLDRDPEAIMAGGMGENDPSWLEAWEAYPDMTAVARGNLVFVPPSSIQRPTPRVLEGSRTLCNELDKVRERR